MGYLINILAEEIKSTPVKRWERVGLLAGLKNPIKKDMAVAFDQAFKELVLFHKNNKINSSFNMDTYFFPIVRRIYSSSINYKKINIKKALKKAVEFYNKYSIPLEYEVLTANTTLFNTLDYEATFMVLFCNLYLISTNNIKTIKKYNEFDEYFYKKIGNLLLKNGEVRLSKKLLRYFEKLK